jgi:hypothetical protein
MVTLPSELHPLPRDHAGAGYCDTCRGTGGAPCPDCRGAGRYVRVGCHQAIAGIRDDVTESHWCDDCAQVVWASEIESEKAEAPDSEVVRT